MPEKNLNNQNQGINRQNLKKPTGLIVTVIILALIILGLVGFGLYWINNKSKDNNSQASNKALQSNATTGNSESKDGIKEPDNLKANQKESSQGNEIDNSDRTFTSEIFGYSFKVPTGYSVMLSHNYEAIPIDNISIGKIINDHYQEDTDIKLTILKNPSTTLDAESKKSNQSDISNKQEITIDQSKAYQYDINGISSMRSVIGYKHNLVLKIDSMFGDNKDDQQVIKSIIDTFKFGNKNLDNVIPTTTNNNSGK